MREWGRKRGPEREEEKEAPRKVLVLAQRTGKTNRAALWSLSLDVHGWSCFGRLRCGAECTVGSGGFGFGFGFGFKGKHGYQIHELTPSVVTCTRTKQDQPVKTLA